MKVANQNIKMTHETANQLVDMTSQHTFFIIFHHLSTISFTSSVARAQGKRQLGLSGHGAAKHVEFSANFGC